MSQKELTKAVAYLRTSSATNLGEGKDSQRRQLAAIEAFAKSAGYVIVDTYSDDAISGADPVDARPGFSAMMARILSNGVRTIIVENASRFSRDLIVQETGFAFLKGKGVALIAADSPDAFLDDGPTAVMVRQILGAVAQFEKAALVSKLAGARARKKAETGKCSGRKSYVETAPEMVAMAKKLARYPVAGQKRSLRAIADELAGAGYLQNGKPYSAAAVASMIRPAK